MRKIDWTLTKSKLEIARRLGHTIGCSRRELIASGLVPLSAVLAAPSLLTLLARSQTAKGQTSSATIPFICFDMAGGAALPGNVLVGKAGGPEDWLRSYSTLGWTPSTGGVDKRFGLPMNTSSGLLTGMIGAMSPWAQANLRLASVCHFSQLDTGDNPQNIASLARAFGSDGKLFQNGLRTLSTLSGGQSASAIPNRAFTPIFVNDVRSLTASMYSGGPVLIDIGTANLQQLALTTKAITESQLDTLLSERNGRTLKQKVDAYLSEDLLQTNFDPRFNPQASSIWGLSPGSPSNSLTVVEATVASCTIDGTAGPSVITLGGCDYHDGTQTTGDGKDAQMGAMIGRAVEYAHVKGQPLFFQLVTDGSCSSLPGTRMWTADTNEGMQIFGFYSPRRVPEYARANMQLGHFNDAQSAERTTVVGSDPKLAALAVFANYCNIHGRLGDFESYSRAFDRRTLEQLVVFAEHGV